MDPWDLVCTNVVIGRETAQTDSPVVCVRVLYVNAEVDVGVVLVVVVGGGDGLECNDIGQCFNLVVLQLQPSLWPWTLVEVRPGIRQTHRTLHVIVRCRHISCLPVRLTVSCPFQSLILIWSNQVRVMHTVLVFQQSELVQIRNVTCSWWVQNQRVTQIVPCTRCHCSVVCCS